MYKSTVELSTLRHSQTFYTEADCPDNDDIDFTPTTGEEEGDTEKVKIINYELTSEGPYTCKRLRSPGIGYEESIPPTHVA